MDEDILKTVESILGKNIKIIDCEKTSSIREEDILLINGIPVQLKGDDGNAIKEALISGQVPSCDLLNQLLFQAGILCKPIELETTLSVKSSMVTKEEITVQRDGNIIDERSSETKEDNIYSSLCQEIWEPLSLSTTTSTTTNTNNTIATSSTSTTCNNNNNNSNNKIKLKSNDKIYNNTNNDYLSTSSSSSSTYNNQLNYDKMLFKNRNHHGIDKMLTTKTVTDIIKKPSSYNQQQQINKYTNIGKTLTESIIYDNNKKIDKISTKSSSSILLGKSSSSSIDNNIKFNEKQKHIINNDNIKSPSLSSSSISSFIPISNNDNSQISISSSSGNCKDFYTNSSISSTSSLSPVQQSNLQLPQQQQQQQQHQQQQQQQQPPTSQSQSATIKYLKNYNINNKKNNHKYYNNDIDNNINNYNNDNDDDDTASSSIYCDTDDNNDDPDDDIINRISDIYINKNKYNNNNNNNNNSNIINNKLINNDKNLSCDSGHEDDDDNTYNNSKDKYLLQNCNTDNSIKLYLDLNKLNNDDNNIIICNNHHIKQKNIISLSPTQSTITITNKNISSNNDDNDDLLLNTSSSNNKNLMNNFQQQTNNYMKNKKVSSITTDKESLSSSSASSMKIYDKTNEILIPTSTPSSSISINTETDTNLLVYRNGELISGPLDSLIKHMVPTSDYYPDYSYTFAFLLSARLFIRPNELFEKICQLCEEQQNINVKNNISLSSSTSSSSNNQSNIIDTNIIKQDTTTTTTTTTTIQKLRMFAKNFLKLLSEWINTFPYDFRDERLMQLVRSMTSKCINIDNNLHKDVSDIVQILLQKLTVLEKYENYLKTIQSNDDIINDIKNQYSNNSSSCNNSNNHNNHNNINYNIDTIDSTTTTVTQSQYHYHNNHHNLGGLLGLSLSSSGHTNSSCSIGSNNSSSGGGGGGAVGGNCTNSNSGGINIGCSGGINNINNSLTLIEIMEICPTPTVLSQQLTHIELECLSHIGPEEFVQVFAKENSKNIEHQSISDTKKTKNLETYVHWFNRLSYFVATEIVKYSKKKQRVRIVEYWIETAQKCFNIGNFNSLMAIIAGLNMSPILRLKKTWAKVQLAKFSVLEHQMDPSSNFNSYRSTLKAAMWRSAGATDERERIIIPFFSLLVKDLYFLNEGCSSRLSNGHINFEKFWQLSKQIKEFISWKQVTCPFERHQNIIIFLQKNHILNENTLALASFECEPPDNNIEKERFKSLKSELMHSTNNSYNHQS